MSYSISEGIEDATEHVHALKDIAAVYPDAYKSDGRWVSGVAPIEKCDGIEVFMGSMGSEDNKVPCVRLYQTVGRGRVYPSHNNWIVLSHFFHNLQGDSDLFKRLLEAMKERCR